METHNTEERPLYHLLEYERSFQVVSHVLSHLVCLPSRSTIAKVFGSVRSWRNMACDGERAWRDTTVSCAHLTDL